MDYFMINKYSAVDENILLIAKNIMGIVEESDKSLSKIFKIYQERYTLEISISMEANIYLAMEFLYSTGQIEYNNKHIGVRREE